MSPPQQIEPAGLADYLETLTKAVFQSGISSRVIEAKWPGFQEALAQFDPTAVARMTTTDVDRLAADTRIVRNRRKIQATVDNAQEMLELAREHRTFQNYLRSHSCFEAAVTDLRKRFRFVGDSSAYHFLYVAGEQVPAHDAWEASRQPEARARSNPRKPG
jgi:3-methyladenine DNA glycosylase Tag